MTYVPIAMTATDRAGSLKVSVSPSITRFSNSTGVPENPTSAAPQYRSSVEGRWSLILDRRKVSGAEVFQSELALTGIYHPEVSLEITRLALGDRLVRRPERFSFLFALVLYEGIVNPVR